MERYNPGTGERTTRAVLIPAFYREMIAGRGPVYLDCASIGEELWEEWEEETMEEYLSDKYGDKTHED